MLLFSTLSLLCCASLPLTDWRGRSFPCHKFAAEWSKVFHWAALSDTLLHHLRRGEPPIVFQLSLLWEIRVTCCYGNRGTPRDWEGGRMEGHRHLAFLLFQVSERPQECWVTGFKSRMERGWLTCVETWTWCNDDLFFDTSSSARGWARDSWAMN